MDQIEDTITTALGLKAALDRLWYARMDGLLIPRADMLRLQVIITVCAEHSALEGA